MAAYEAARDQLAADDIDVVALSTDDREHAAGTVDDLSLTFPVGYGVPLHDTARALGAFYEPRRQILHATGFVLRPDSTIGVACYSSGPIGRIVPDDVARYVAFWKRALRETSG